MRLNLGAHLADGGDHGASFRLFVPVEASVDSCVGAAFARTQPYSAGTAVQGLKAAIAGRGATAAKVAT